MNKITKAAIAGRIRARLRSQTPPASGQTGHPVFEPAERPAWPEGSFNRFLWRHGTRHAGFIKKIPVIRNIAERCYRKLAGPNSTAARQRPAAACPAGPGYGQFVEQLRTEGFKGRVKLTIFKCIGFAGWWQEQINSTLFQKIEGLRDETAATRNDMHAREKLLEDVSAQLSCLRQYNMALHREYEDLRREYEVLRGDYEVLRGEHEVLREENFRQEAVITEMQVSIDKISAGDDLSSYGPNYCVFEDIFRGSRDTIKQRQRQYLADVQKAYEQSGGRFLLDIGCGRGEFLELLPNPIAGRGIDINSESVRICKGLGLAVEEADAVRYLNEAEDNSLIGVTAFQVIEHLTPGYLKELIRLSHLKIKNGGVMILETVNPLSLYALRNFFMDITHKSPIPPNTMKFLAETSGFINVEIRFSSPASDDVRLTGDDENVGKLNDLLFGYQDYAIIAWK